MTLPPMWLGYIEHATAARIEGPYTKAGEPVGRAESPAMVVQEFSNGSNSPRR